MRVLVPRRNLITRVGTATALLLVALSWFASSAAFAQTTVPMPQYVPAPLQAGSAYLPQWLSWGDGRVLASARLGLQRQKMKAVFGKDVHAYSPYPSPDTLMSIQGPTTLELDTGNIWVAGLGVEVFFNDIVSLYCSGERNIKRSITTSGGCDFNDGGLGSRFQALEWTGNGVVYALELGAAVRLIDWLPPLTIGAKYDRSDLTLEDGTSSSLDTGPGGWTYAIKPDRAEFMARVWVPFIGLRYSDENCTLSIMGSPLGNTDIRYYRTSRLNLTRLGFLVDGEPDPPDWHGSSFVWWRLKGPSGFIEADAEYRAQLSASVGIRLWLKGNWWRASGKENMDIWDDTNAPAVVPILPGPVPTAIGPTQYQQVEGSGTTFTRLGIAGGLVGTVTF